MTSEVQEAKKRAGRKKMTVEEEIAYFAKKLADARAKQREQEDARRKQNEKDVLVLLRSENLLAVPSDAWKAALQEIRKVLDRADRKQVARASEVSRTVDVAREPKDGNVIDGPIGGQSPERQPSVG